MILRSFDVETDGVLREYALQPWRVWSKSAWLSSCAWTTDGEPAVLFKPDVEQLAGFLRSCAAEGAYIVGWNIAFDIGWLLAMGLRDLVYANKWLDGMLLYKHLTNYPTWHDDKVESYSLKEAVRKFLPEFADYEKDIEYAEPEDPSEKLLWQVRLLHYNKLDAELTLTLAEKFLNELTPATKRNALIEAACLPMVSEASLNGLTTAPTDAHDLAETLTETQGSRFLSLKMADMTNVTDVVLSSPKQLSELLYGKWKLPVPALTETGQPSTDKAALARLSLHDDRAALLHEWREAKNNRTKFCDAVVTSAAYNASGQHINYTDGSLGITRPAPRVFGTYTGRMTYSSKQGKGKNERPTGVALHQWKRDPAFRKLIRAPEGYTLLEFDFAGQEYRWMAVESGDPTMLQMCAPGEDPHAFMGSRIARANYHTMLELVKAGETQAKKARQFGKVANLSCIAGGQRVLTDRGYVPIEEVAVQDKLWDGISWVRHDGVIYQGKKETMFYGGIEATSDHRVRVGNRWAPFVEAARHGWKIKSALEPGPGLHRAAVRFVDGLRPHPGDKERRRLCDCRLRLRTSEAGEPTDDGGRQVTAVQGVCDERTTCSMRTPAYNLCGEAAVAAARQLHAAALRQPERPIVPQLRGARHSVQVPIGEGVRGLHSRSPAAPDIPATGHRSSRQRWTLRAGQPATGRPTDQPTQPKKVYDILNAGPRHRFVVEGMIVSNCQYRTSAGKLQEVSEVQHRLPMTAAEARAIHGAYQQTYREVPRYWERQIFKARRNGYVTTIAGRVVQLGTGDNWNHDHTWGLGSTAINFPIQGAGADQKYLALLVLRDYLPKVDGRFYYELHDGVFVIVPNHLAQKAAKEIKHLLSNLPYKKAWGVNLPVNFPVDAKLGPSWGELVEWTE